MDLPVDLNNVIAISTGAQFSQALKSDGTVISWGRNYNNSTDIPVSYTHLTLPTKA